MLLFLRIIQPSTLSRLSTPHNLTIPPNHTTIYLINTSQCYYSSESYNHLPYLDYQHLTMLLFLRIIQPSTLSRLSTPHNLTIPPNHTTIYLYLYYQHLTMLLFLRIIQPSTLSRLSTPHNVTIPPNHTTIYLI